MSNEVVDLKWEFIIEDGVHPYPDLVDRWVVIVNGDEVAWANDKPTAERSYIEMLRVRADHARRNPANLEDAPIPVYAGGVLQMTL